MRVLTLTDADGNLFPPIMQARAMAQYARSPLSILDIVEKVSVENAETFQEKWVVKYGHNSVAELATIPVCFEGVSMLAAKAIEAWQRPGVAEKSTRMQDFSGESFYDPTDESNVTLEDEYCLKGNTALLYAVRALVDRAYELYAKMLKELPEKMSEQYPDETDAQIKKRVFDSARYLLPAGTVTSLGICAYPRDIAEMIATLGSSKTGEFRRIARLVKDTTSELGGPLIRHVEPEPWRNYLWAKYPRKHYPNSYNDIRLLNSDGTYFNGEVNPPYMDGAKKLVEKYYDLNDFESHMYARPAHGPAPRLFRNVRLQFEVTLDYGAFRDLQRHRRSEQTVELLTPHYGYETPDIPDRKLLREYEELLDMYMALPWPVGNTTVNALQYFLPMAFRIRFLWDMDLEEAYYIPELRTKPGGHISYRRLTWNMAEQTRAMFPWGGKWIRAINPDDPPEEEDDDSAS